LSSPWYSRRFDRELECSIFAIGDHAGAREPGGKPKEKNNGAGEAKA